MLASAGFAIKSTTYVPADSDGQLYPVMESDSDQFPWLTSADRNDYESPTATERQNLNASDNVYWTTDDPGSGDDMAVTVYLPAGLVDTSKLINASIVYEIKVPLYDWVSLYIHDPDDTNLWGASYWNIVKANQFSGESTLTYTMYDSSYFWTGANSGKIHYVILYNATSEAVQLDYLGLNVWEYTLNAAVTGLTNSTAVNQVATINCTSQDGAITGAWWDEDGGTIYYNSTDVLNGTAFNITLNATTAGNHYLSVTCGDSYSGYMLTNRTDYAITNSRPVITQVTDDVPSIVRKGDILNFTIEWADANLDNVTAYIHSYPPREYYGYPPSVLMGFNATNATTGQNITVSVDTSNDEDWDYYGYGTHNYTYYVYVVDMTGTNTTWSSSSWSLSSRGWLFVNYDDCRIELPENTTGKGEDYNLTLNFTSPVGQSNATLWRWNGSWNIHQFITGIGNSTFESSDIPYVSMSGNNYFYLQCEAVDNQITQSNLSDFYYAINEVAGIEEINAVNATISPSIVYANTSVNCSTYITSNNDSLFANFTWYVNGVNKPAYNTVVSCTNNTVCWTDILLSEPIYGEFFSPDEIVCSVAGYNANISYSSGWVNSSEVVVSNSPPTLLSVYIDGSLGTPNVVPIEAGNANINVTFYAQDVDQWFDIKSHQVSVTDGTTNSSCQWTYYNTTTTAYQCNLQLQYDDLGGLKNVSIFVEDWVGHNVTDDNRQLMYQTIYVVGLNDTNITWNGVISGVSDNVGEALRISNTGNGIVDMNITGADLSGSGKTLAIGNFSIDDDGIPSEGAETGKNEMTLLSSAQDYSPVAGIAVGGSYDTYFFLDVPLNLGTKWFTTSSTQWTIDVRAH